MSTTRKVIYTFETFTQWVNKAATRIAGTGAECIDARGRVCRIGRDFMRARDEDAFPVVAYAPPTDAPAVTPAGGARGGRGAIK
jgi:hypothetical protein